MTQAGIPQNAHLVSKPVYLDNHATTRVDRQVASVVLDAMTEHYGNASSTGHPYGWKARELVEQARQNIAALLGSDPDEVVFTSGATESINMVLKGLKRDTPLTDWNVVSCVTEHSATLDTLALLEKQGARVARLGVDPVGELDLGELEQHLKQRPKLVSLLHANNETGVIFPAEKICALCREHGVPVHLDVAQSAGKVPVQLHQWDCDFLSVSAHKIYGPKGVGCLLIRRRNPPHRLTPLITGGGQERGFRSGTLNVPGIAGFGKAAELCRNEMAEEAERASRLRNQLLQKILAALPDAKVNGTLESRLPGNLNMSFPGINGPGLLPKLRETVSLSSGSACTSAHPTPSHVLMAMGVSADLAAASIRIGIGRFNTREEIDFAAQAIVTAVNELRA